MLVREFKVMTPDPILAMVAMVSGRSSGAREIREGVYEIGHFGSSHFLPGYEDYPENLSVDCYGVCDSVDQLLTKCPELTSESRKFVVTVTPVRRAEEPADGGWRWHKWGPYIGDKQPQCEYLHDEPDIEEVLVYRIYEKQV